MTYLDEKKLRPRTETPGPSHQTNYDLKPPQALVDFMLRDWQAAPSRPPARVRNADAFHARRRALSRLFPGELLVVPTGHEKVRANDTLYRFRPGTDFYYLTGNLEPDCVLVLVPEAGGHRDVLFVEPNPGRTDATFYTDRAKGELWVGPRLGVAQSQARYGVDEARSLTELNDALGAWRVTLRFRHLRGQSDGLDRALPVVDTRDKDFATALSELRLIKDRLEIQELATAIASTKRGFEDVIRMLGEGAGRRPVGAAGRSERWVEGVFGLRARVEGNDVGYGTIAAAGAHACVLHWTRNDGPLRSGDLLLLDAGVEAHTLYTADITRTLPISGRFSKEQREIYDLVHAAQAAAFTGVKPGNDFLEPNRRAMRVLAEGLERLGILRCRAAEALADEKQFYKRYSLHNVSHMLGLDVHDCAQARQEAYKYGKLRPGMVLTVEPGLYFQTDDLTVPRKYRGIGVRIEDDVVVTARGMRNLSAAIPRSADEIEAWMKQLRRR
jgi:Xaa-Pro aminopeptidase